VTRVGDAGEGAGWYAVRVDSPVSTGWLRKHCAAAWVLSLIQFSCFPVLALMCACFEFCDKKNHIRVRKANRVAFFPLLSRTMPQVAPTADTDGTVLANPATVQL
jgi:hypothetical protein